MINKSEELAKLLGIEHKFINIICKGQEPKYRCNVYFSPNEHCLICEKGKPCRFIYSKQEIYPDFTKPSNFVKLLEICYKADNTLLETTSYANSYIEDFINKLIKFIDDNNKFFSLYNYCGERYILCQELIGQAQQTEWEY